MLENDNPGAQIEIVNNSGLHEPLGTYESVERAKEVLKYIVEEMQMKINKSGAAHELDLFIKTKIAAALELRTIEMPEQ